jgi:hypothetical protein
MKFYSKEEICAYFNIDTNKSEKEIIKDLTRMQVELHPDKIGKQTEEEKIKYSKIDDAKSFLRSNHTEVMIPLSDVRDIISLVKNENMPLVLSRETIEEKIQNTSQKIIKNTKGTWKPMKITTTSVAIMMSAIWAFPSVITEHPILQSTRFYDEFYFALTVMWILSLIFGGFVWLIAYKKEKKVKVLLDVLKNEDVQFEIFSDFKNCCKKSKKMYNPFTIKDVEKHIKSLIYNNGIELFYFDKTEGKKMYGSKRCFSNISDIIPEVSQIIVARALEKNVIAKEDKNTWYDSYIFND